MSVRSFYRPLYLPAQMRAIDREAIEVLGVPALELMENAGSACADKIAALYRQWSCRGPVQILCGQGHNGGDGLVVARHLAQAGIAVRPLLLAPEENISTAARTMLERARSAGLSPLCSASSPDLEPDTGMIVDAILGTGAEGALRPPSDLWARVVNASGVPVVAIDAPSGVDLGTGAVPGDAFRARATLALAELKPGYFVHPGRCFAGTVYPLDIGIPARARRAAHSDLYLITPEGVNRLLPERVPDGHKGTFGRVAIIGGSEGMTGAPLLASQAALRAGCGLVTLGVPAGLQDICAAQCAEVITRPLPALRHKRCLAVRSEGEACRLAAEADACVVGCGAGRHRETQECIARLVERLDVPLVLDADGLYPFGSDPDRLVRHRGPLAITPHSGELARLFGERTESVQADRVGHALRAARHFDCVAVLKGAGTVVGTVTGQAYINPTGNSGLATAGSGDVLAGVIGSLLAQGMSVLGAATAGVYLHGLAGDLAAHSWGERGMVAGDIVFDLPGALRIIAERSWAEGY